MKIVSLENILTIGEYNDLGLQVRDKLLILAEAQSTFSRNVCLRVLMYLSETYKQYVEEHKLDLYGARTASIPRPELYVVYTGEKQDVPDVLRLSDLYEGEGAVDLRVKVCRGNGTRDIVDQYVRFCKITDEKRKQYGRTQEAITEILRQCEEENILTPFLASRQKEVKDIMVTLFDQEKVLEIHDYNVAKEAAAEGHKQGISETAKKLAKSFGFSVEQAMAVLDTSD